MLCGPDNGWRNDNSTIGPGRSFRGAPVIAMLAAVAKMPALAKVLMACAVIVSGIAAVGLAGAPVANPWFDMFAGYFLLQALNAFVGGAPEPDVFQKIKRNEMGWGEFWYLWFYRSSHLFLSQATAFFLHPEKWKDISGKEPLGKE